MATRVFGSDYKVQVKGAPIDTTVKVINDRSMIGLRDVGEALGLDVRYEGESKQVYLDITYEGIGNLLILDLNTGLAHTMIWGDGDLYEYERNNLRLEVAPKMIEGRVYVPLRFVCDIFGSPVSVSGKHITIGDIFSSGLVTARLDEAQKKLAGRKEVQLYDRYIRDTDKLAAIHTEVEFYDSELVNAPYYLGPEGYYMSLNLMDLYSFVTGMNMETKEGHKLKVTYESLMLSLGNQYSDLGNYIVPSSTRVDNYMNLIKRYEADLDAFLKKRAEVEKKANN